MENIVAVLNERRGPMRIAEFARKRGLPPVSAYAWLTGQRQIGLDGVRVIARAFPQDDEVHTALVEYVFGAGVQMKRKRK